MSREKAYRRWKTFSKYVTRVKKRLSWMRIKYGETTFKDADGNERKKWLWRNPKDWKEADLNDKASKTLKKTPTPYTSPWKKAEIKTSIKKMRDESRRIIDDELNNET